MAAAANGGREALARSRGRLTTRSTNPSRLCAGRDGQTWPDDEARSLSGASASPSHAAHALLLASVPSSGEALGGANGRCCAAFRGLANMAERAPVGTNAVRSGASFAPVPVSRGRESVLGAQRVAERLPRVWHCTRRFKRRRQSKLQPGRPNYALRPRATAPLWTAPSPTSPRLVLPRHTHSHHLPHSKRGWAHVPHGRE